MRFAQSDVSPAVVDGVFTREHEDLRTEVRAFVDRELRPHAADWEAAEAFPKELFARAGSLGLFGLKYPPELGGAGPDLAADAVVTEELARCGSGGVAAALGAHKDLATLHLYNFGNAGQHRKWLEPAIHGEVVGALAVTEPGAGSDVAGISCTARRGGDGWTISGQKTFITNGAWADFVVVAAKTDAGAGHRGLSLFVVDAGTSGFETRRIRTLGWRPSQTGELWFEDVRVPETHLLGDEGGGFTAIMRNFEWERLVMALGAVVGAEETYRLAKAYALERHAFGRPIGKFQVWRHRFADLATSIEAARALTYHALRLMLEGEPALRQVAMAKLYATELAVQVADECVQAHGGYGYTTEFPAERALRDARLGPIGGGTSEIMREIIGRTYGLG